MITTIKLTTKKFTTTKTLYEAQSIVPASRVSTQHVGYDQPMEINSGSAQLAATLTSDGEWWRQMSSPF